MKAMVFTEPYNEKLKQLAAVPIPGQISLQYLREKDFFEGVRVQGKINDVVGVFHENKVTVMVTRSIKEVYINGVPRNIAYLSGLRVAPEVRGLMHLAHGYKYLKKLDTRFAPMLYLCTFIRGNTHAVNSITRSFRGLLQYHYLKGFCTTSLYIPKRKKRNPEYYEVISGSLIDQEKLISFLQAEGARKNFFPVYTLKNLNTLCKLENFRIILQNGEIVAAAAVIDQSRFKQLKVYQYNHAIKSFRRAINFFYALRNLPGLPCEGENFRILYLGCIAIKNNDSELFKKIIDAILTEFSGQGYHFLSVGLCEDDPLLKTLKYKPRINYFSDLYFAAWDNHPGHLYSENKSRLSYLELAAL